jgi:hypothetical protein
MAVGVSASGGAGPFWSELPFEMRHRCRVTNRTSVVWANSQGLSL